MFSNAFQLHRASPARGAERLSAAVRRRPGSVVVDIADQQQRRLVLSLVWTRRQQFGQQLRHGHDGEGQFFQQIGAFLAAGQGGEGHARQRRRRERSAPPSPHAGVSPAAARGVGARRRRGASSPSVRKRRCRASRQRSNASLMGLTGPRSTRSRESRRTTKATRRRSRLPLPLLLGRG